MNIQLIEKRVHKIKIAFVEALFSKQKNNNNNEIKGVINLRKYQWLIEKLQGNLGLDRIQKIRKKRDRIQTLEELEERKRVWMNRRTFGFVRIGIRILQNRNEMNFDRRRRKYLCVWVVFDEMREWEWEREKERA